MLLKYTNFVTLTSKSLKTSRMSGFLALDAAFFLLTVLLSLLTLLRTAAACSLGRGLTASPNCASVTSKPAWNGAANDARPAACSHSASSSPSVRTKGWTLEWSRIVAQMPTRHVLLLFLHMTP